MTAAGSFECDETRCFGSDHDRRFPWYFLLGEVRCSEKRTCFFGQQVSSCATSNGHPLSESTLPLAHSRINSKKDLI